MQQLYFLKVSAACCTIIICFLLALNCFSLLFQVAFYEILNGMWVRNGLQIKGQMMTYIQCNFCNSMVDADLYLLQVCATQIDPEVFLLNVIDM